MFNINVPGVILAGGQSRRMNRKDKAFLEIGERTLLDMIIERLGPQSYKMAINTNSYSHKYKRYGLPILHDHMEGYLGPLAGILTAMEWAKDTGYEKVITVAVDDTVKSSFVKVWIANVQPLSNSPLPENLTSLSCPKDCAVLSPLLVT